MAKRNYAGKYGTRQAIRSAQSAIAAHQRAWEVFIDSSTKDPNCGNLEASQSAMFTAITAVEAMYRLGHSRRSRAANFSQIAQNTGRDVGRTFAGHIIESPHVIQLQQLPEQAA